MEATPGTQAGGHFAIGGIAIDTYASARDPAFYLHHAQVDRIWTLWQNINNRTRQVYGTSTAFNSGGVLLFAHFFSGEKKERKKRRGQCIQGADLNRGFYC